MLAEAAEGIDLDRGVVTSPSGVHPRPPRLATGPRVAFERIPGLGPGAGHTQSVCNSSTLSSPAMRGRGAKAGLPEVAPVTFVTAEPFLGHFGLGGVGDSERLVDRTVADSGSRDLPNTSIAEVREGEMELAGGRVLPFAYVMIVPPIAGLDMVRDTPGLADDDGSMDGGNTGIIMKTDKVLGDAKHPHLIAGPQAHWAKVAFECFFIETRRRGHVRV